MGSEGENVRVYARFRPLNGKELTGGHSNANFDLTFQSKQSLRLVHNDPGHGLRDLDFSCDRVFDTNSAQLEVFDVVARSMVEDVVKGFNATIFAYGQTGSGKTFTMFGFPNNEERGIIPRSADHLFQCLSGASDVAEATIKVSLLEIYREVVKDLLKPTKEQLKVREGASGETYVEQLYEEYVGSSEEIMALLELGQQHRAVSRTDMNETSSRSHCVLIITVTSKLHTGQVRVGKLNLADLAGSEKVAKTNATGQTLKEAQGINKSLSALGNCIYALTERGRAHIPYRDSKLTFILKDSLGGNTKTALMVACSPSPFNSAETMSTLRFAQRAKMIKNEAKANTQLSAEELIALVAQLRKQIAALKAGEKGADADPGGVAIAPVPDREPDSERTAALEAEVRHLTGQNRALEAENKALADKFAAYQQSVAGQLRNMWTGTPDQPRGSNLRASVMNGLGRDRSASMLRFRSSSVADASGLDSLPARTLGPSAGQAVPPRVAMPPLTSGDTPAPIAPALLPAIPDQEEDGESGAAGLTDGPSAPDDREEGAQRVALMEEELALKDQDLLRVMDENAALQSQVEELKRKLIDAHKTKLEHRASISGGGAEAVAAAGPRIVKPVTNVGSVSSLVSISFGLHIITPEVKSLAGLPIISVSVRECESAESSSAIIGVANMVFKPLQWAFGTGKIGHSNHTWLELKIGTAADTHLVCVQKHLNGDISMDYALDVLECRKIAMSSAGIDTDAPVFDTSVETACAATSNPKTLGNAVDYVLATDPSYHSVTNNRRFYATMFVDWYKLAVVEHEDEDMDMLEAPSWLSEPSKDGRK